MSRKADGPLLIISAAVCFLVSTPAAAADGCSHCVEIAEKGLKEVFQLDEGENVMQRTEAWLCSSDFESWAKTSDTGFSLSIPILDELVPFDFNSSSDESWRRLRELCRQEKLDFRRSTMKHVYMVRLGKDAAAIMNQCFRTCPGATGSIVDGDVQSKSTHLLVDLRWIGSQDQVGTIMRVTWSGDIQRCSTDGLVGKPLRRSGVSFACDWGTKAGGSGALIVATDKGDWSGVVAQSGLEPVGTLSVSYNTPGTQVVPAGNKCGVVTTPELDHVKCRNKGGKIFWGHLPVDVPVRVPGATPVCKHIKNKSFGWLELDIKASLGADRDHWFTSTGHLSCVKGGTACRHTRLRSANDQPTEGEPGRLVRKLRCGSHSQVWEFCAPQSTKKGVLNPVSKTLDLYSGGEISFRASSSANLVAKVGSSHIEFPAGTDIPGMLEQVGRPGAVSGSPTDYYYKYRVVHGTKDEPVCPEAPVTEARPPETTNPPGCRSGGRSLGESSILVGLLLLAPSFLRRRRSSH